MLRVTYLLLGLSCMVAACGKKGPLDPPVSDMKVQYPAVYPKSAGDDQDFSIYENENRE